MMKDGMCNKKPFPVAEISKTRRRGLNVRGKMFQGDLRKNVLTQRSSWILEHIAC